HSVAYSLRLCCQPPRYGCMQSRKAINVPGYKQPGAPQIKQGGTGGVRMRPGAFEHHMCHKISRWGGSCGGTGRTQRGAATSRATGMLSMNCNNCSTYAAGVLAGVTQRVPGHRPPRSFISAHPWRLCRQGWAERGVLWRALPSKPPNCVTPKLIKAE